jgi:hypothetical protein
MIGAHNEKLANRDPAAVFFSRHRTIPRLDARRLDERGKHAADATKCEGIVYVQSRCEGIEGLPAAG